MVCLQVHVIGVVGQLSIPAFARSRHLINSPFDDTFTLITKQVLSSGLEHTSATSVGVILGQIAPGISPLCSDALYTSKVSKPHYC